MKKVIGSLFVMLLFSVGVVHGQEAEEENDRTYTPLTLKLDEDGDKYIRFITWLQVWGEDQDLGSDESGFGLRLRRSRLLTYAKIRDRFLILTHFGVNSLQSSNLDPIGNRATTDPSVNGPQIFLHGAWTEYKITNGNELYVGAGLHYWNGLSRLNSASTLNFATLDNYRQGWATLGAVRPVCSPLGYLRQREIRQPSVYPRRERPQCQCAGFQ